MYIAVLIIPKLKGRQGDVNREEQHAKCCFKGTSRSETKYYSADQIKEAFATTDL